MVWWYVGLFLSKLLVMQLQGPTEHLHTSIHQQSALHKLLRHGTLNKYNNQRTNESRRTERNPCPVILSYSILIFIYLVQQLLYIHFILPIHSIPANSSPKTALFTFHCCSYIQCYLYYNMLFNIILYLYCPHELPVTSFSRFLISSLDINVVKQ